MAATYLSKQAALKDSLFTKEKFAVIQELQAKYESEKKDRNLQTSALKLKIQKQKNLWLLGLCFLLIILLVLVYYIQHKRIQSHILLAQQNQKVATLTEQTLKPNCGNDFNNENDRANGLSEEKVNELLRELLRCMEEKKMFTDPLFNLDMLADEIGTNRTYLSIVINSRIHKTFAEYVNFYRVEEAKRLLRNSNEKIVVICRAAGFGSPQTFYSIFKQFEKLTPSEYRKAAQRKSIQNHTES